MRKASDNYGLIVIDDKFIGVSLGYDFCAEHEWGIKNLKRIFGIPEPCKENMGVKSRSITKNIDYLCFVEDKVKKVKTAALFTGNKYGEKMDDLPRDLENYKKNIEWNMKWNAEHPDSRHTKDPMVSAWDEGSFGVAVVGDKEVEYLQELRQAFIDVNVVITHINLSPKNPFANSSLSLLIADRIPQESIDAMYAADKEYFDKIDYEEKIGMKKILEKHGNKDGYRGAKYFCACSPKWINYEDAVAREEQKKKYNTKFDIMYWVNYSDDNDNSGWYSVEEIREWMTTKKKLVEIRKGR